MAAALINYFFNRKRCPSEIEVAAERETTQRVYFRAEFESIGDVLKDKHLRKEEFVRLLSLLGYPGDVDEIAQIWNACVPEDIGLMTLEEYIQLMSDEAIRTKTDVWRKLFAQFDKDGNGFATKKEVMKGLESIGVTITTTLRTNIESIDENKDGKISYGEFLKKQLQQ